MDNIENMLHWGRIKLVTEVERQVATDVVLYGDRSYLLLPNEGEENRFFVKASKDHIEFDIGSTSLENYNLMKGFFTKLYSCDVYDSEKTKGDQIKNEGLNVVLKNRKISLSRGIPYFPEFLRNLIYMPSSIEGLEIEYTVITKATTSFLKKKKFNFIILVTLYYDRPSDETTLGYLRNELRKMRNVDKWKMSMYTKSRVGFRADLLSDSAILYNFVRIPLEEEAQ